MPLIMVSPYKKLALAVKTALLLHLNTLTNNQLVDEAHSNNIPIPYNPSHIAVTKANPQTGTQSLQGFGRNEILYTTNTSAFNLSGGDYTLEFFFYPNTHQSCTLFTVGGIINVNWQALSVYTDDADYLYYCAFSSPSTGGSSSATTIGNGVKSSAKYNVGAWNHIAVVRQGNVHSLYLNGVRVMSITSALAPYAPTNPTILMGYPHDTATNVIGSQSWDGFYDQFRVTRGVARYSGAAYTVPTTAFGKTVAADPYWANVSCLLDFESVDGNGAPVDATTATSWTYIREGNKGIFLGPAGPFGSNALRVDDPSSGYLVDERAGLTLGTGDFTAEFWLYTEVNTNVYKSLVATRANTFACDNGFSIGMYAQGLYVYTNQFLVPTSGNVPLLKWNHVAVVRRNGVLTLYLNGVALGIYSATVYNFSESRLGIGCNTNGSENWLGSNTRTYLSELRISKVARYTANFAVPTKTFVVD